MENMNLSFNHIDVAFDDSGNTVISRHKLLAIINQIKTVNVFSNAAEFPSECYVLVDKNAKDFYPLTKDELKDWENDGSIETGDKLYKMKLKKEF